MALRDMFTKAISPRDGSEAPRQPQLMYLNNGLAASVIQWNDHIAVNSAMQHPLVYRALNKIAEAVSQVPWVAQVDPLASAADQRNKASAIQEINTLLKSPNDSMTPSQLRYWMSLNWSGYGRVPMRFSTAAINPERVNGVFPLEARHTRVNVDERGNATKYRYGEQESSQSFNSQYTWRKKGHPFEGFADQIWRPGLKGYMSHQDQNSPLKAIGLPAEVMKLLLVRAAQTASGHPNVRYLVSCSKTLTESQKKALAAHLNKDHGVEGPKAGNIPILQNVNDLQIHTLENDLSDIHSKVPSDDMARLIFGAFGIPLALAGIGAADASKFAGNFQESWRFFWQDTIAPGHINPMFEGMTRLLCPPGVEIVADWDKVPAMQSVRRASMKEASGIDFLTTNEKRQMFGYEDDDDFPQYTQRAGSATSTATTETTK